jgi:putative transposase
MKNFDYTSAGAYYVTICTAQRIHSLSRIIEQEVHLSTLGCIVEEEWLRAETIREYIHIGAYVIMPNHIHGLVYINDVDRSNTNDRSTTLAPRSLGAVIGQFKRATTARARQLGIEPPNGIWQRNFYEHIVRNDADHSRIVAYIAANPRRWGYS